MPAALYDQRVPPGYAAPPPYGHLQPFSAAPVYAYYPPPYAAPSRLYSRDGAAVMVLHGAPDGAYPGRVGAALEAPFARGPAAPGVPPRGDKKPRLVQPPAAAPKAAAPAAPKDGAAQLQLPKGPVVAFDHRTAPGCFDIVGRGPLPRITFSTEVTL
jgi:hypothetical protein